ncbi:MAG: hypothetical protein ABJH07_27395 [Sedimentitalea sp.]|uniref:hypothetical protein n=1 Tax=Sedimentitalea sp. TaxID=2048915 RepID=UPI003262E464
MTINKRSVLGCLGAAALAVCVGVVAPPIAADEQDVHLLFVQGASEMRADPDTKSLRLIGITDQTVYFSDRPVRLAGHVGTSKFVEHWASGDDSFASNPPNATLSVYDEADQKNHASVLVLRDPVLEGDDLVYGYELLGGGVPETGGAVALFIDTFGPGGGVGAGFHGVGVGARGPGVVGWRGAVVESNCADGKC